MGVILVKNCNYDNFVIIVIASYVTCLVIGL